MVIHLVAVHSCWVLCRFFSVLNLCKNVDFMGYMRLSQPGQATVLETNRPQLAFCCLSLQVGFVLGTVRT